MADEKLNVIALISGGKDSFFSLLHCRANGHRVVALANLHPAAATLTTGTIDITVDPASAAPIPAPVLAPSSLDAGGEPRGEGTVGVVGVAPSSSSSLSPPTPGGAPGNEVDEGQYEDEHDLNSFMYQTVGHQVIPLYAEATGIPLYRRAIAGGAAQQGKDYSHYGAGPAAGVGSGPTAEIEQDETESMLHLLQTVKAAHPEANAVCAGAILSTYQRTRVESVATRLGLTPLAFLWKFPVLPAPAPTDDAQLLADMAAVGLEARIIKVASGGLDDGFLWTNVASHAGKNRILRAMGRFGAVETGAAIGEGGEFETLVLDGPPTLFKKRIVVAEEKDRRVVREGGGSAWLSIKNATLQDKQEDEATTTAGGEDNIRIPNLLDPRFDNILSTVSNSVALDLETLRRSSSTSNDAAPLPLGAPPPLQYWTFASSAPAPSVQDETAHLMVQIRSRLASLSLPPTAVLSSTILLRSMSSFTQVNPIYAALFTTAPNPPSRVCVAVGDALPERTNVVIILSVHPTLAAERRQGLHVQSRSYWAPANIGPYSQAVWCPWDGEGASELVSVAGQIPLVPGSMLLPRKSDDGIGGEEMEAVLALQHLWRIGVETGVKYWGFGVAYFPGVSEDKIRLAGRVWEAAHEADDKGEDEDDDTGPDLWDRKYNYEFLSYAADGKNGGKQGGLPDWGVVKKGERRVPPVFVAEVEELPRGAGIEWQGGLGLRGVEEEEVELREVEGGRMWQVVVGQEGGRRFVQSVVVEMFGDEEEKEVEGVNGTAVVAVRYVDASVYPFDVEERMMPVVPCKSLWDGKGQRLKSVTVYHGVI